MKKIIPITITIFLLGLGLYYLSSNQPQKTNQVTPQQTSTPSTSATNNSLDKTTVSEVTSNFYKDYDSCMKNPPAKAAGQVSEYCQNNTGLTTTTFAANLEKGGTAKAGADPIFCAQNPPENIAVNQDIQITDGKAVAFVNKKMGPTQIKIQVNLLKENKDWKVDNIVCPLP